MFIHWRITGLPRDHGDRFVERLVMDALTIDTTIKEITPGSIDNQGRLKVTAYFPVDYNSTPELRASLTQSYQSLLRGRLRCDTVVVHDVTT